MDSHTNSEREYRSVPFKDTDIKGRRFRGYAAVHDVMADLGSWVEEIRRGAFRKILATKPYVPMLFNHNGMLPPLASTRSGMTLKEDGRGLLVEAELANHFAAEAVIEGIERGDIRGMSFGFVAGEGNSHIEMRDGKPHRTILNFKALLDVSPTHDPAYHETSAELRSMFQMVESIEASQTSVIGEQPQSDEIVEAADAADGDSTQEPTTVVVDEQRSGVDFEVEATARMRELEALALKHRLSV